jgi:four helix bundle protein
LKKIQGMEIFEDGDGKYLTSQDVSAFKIAFDLSNYVWQIVFRWDYFSKRTVGVQFVNAVDSISANIAEGFGRYFKKDKINFYRFARGSAMEALDWNKKAILRNLISQEQNGHIEEKLNHLPKEINKLIRITNDKLKI